MRRRLLPLALAVVCPGPVGAGLPAVADDVAMASSMTLGDVLETVLQRSGTGVPADALDHGTSGWLAAQPSLGLSYIYSQAELGTDEAEVALSLPLKSPARRRADASLRALEPQLVSARGELRRLYYSGLLREAYWSHRIAWVQREGARETLRLLQRLAERQQALVDAGSTPQYALLLIEREMLAVRGREEGLGAELERWRLRYRDLTGMGTLPKEPPKAPPLDSPNVLAHPALRLLELNWQLEQALIDADSARAAPWTVSVIGRQLDGPALKEDQVGLALEVPLSVFDVARQSEVSDRAEGARQYHRSRDELLRDLEVERRTLEADRKALGRQQSLLEQADDLNRGIAAQLRALRAGNEIEAEVLLRRFLDIVETRTELALVSARLGKTEAMLRQAHGIPL